MIIKRNKVNERIGYILDNYYHLLTRVEDMTYRSFVISTNGKYEDYGWPGIRSFLELGEEEFYKNLEDRIIDDNKDKIKFNYCPKCKSLTKTPNSKMCLKCKHKWHIK